MKNISYIAQEIVWFAARMVTQNHLRINMTFDFIVSNIGGDEEWLNENRPAICTAIEAWQRLPGSMKLSGPVEKVEVGDRGFVITVNSLYAETLPIIESVKRSYASSLAPAV